jgi:hypothetical protein
MISAHWPPTDDHSEQHANPRPNPLCPRITPAQRTRPSYHDPTSLDTDPTRHRVSATIISYHSTITSAPACAYRVALPGLGPGSFWRHRSRQCILPAGDISCLQHAPVPTANRNRGTGCRSAPTKQHRGIPRVLIIERTLQYKYSPWPNLTAPNDADLAFQTSFFH